MFPLTLIASACFSFGLVGCEKDPDCAHEWQNTSVSTQATCTVGGSQEQKCANCGEVQTIETLPLNHDFATAWGTGENGHWHVCVRDNCGEKSDEAAHGDENDDHLCDECQVEVSEHTGGKASCTNKAVCSVCGEEYGDLANHSLDDSGQCENCDYACTTGLLFKDIDENTTAVIGLISDMQDVVIPETYQGKRVVSIERGAFYGRAIKSVTILSTIEKIGVQAFGNCTALEKVHLDLESWLNIDFAYYYSTVNYEAKVESNPLANPKAKPYVDGELLNDVVIPEGGTEIKPYAFFKLKANSVTIPSTLKKVGTYAFYKNNLTYVFTPDIETWLGIEFKHLNGLIYYHSSTGVAKLCLSGTTEAIRDLVVPDGVTSIGIHAFEGYTLLTSVTLNSDLRSIGEYAFYNCDNLTSVYLDSVENWCNIRFGRVWANPLEDNSSAKVYFKGESEPIKELTIPQSVTEIGNRQFKGWRDLTKVTLHSGITKIGEGAFGTCTKIKEVYVPSIDFWCEIDFVKSLEGLRSSGDISSNPIAYSATLYVNNEAITDLVIPEGVTSISAGAFWGLKQLTSVTIPNSVKTIGESAFRYCKNLTAVNIKSLEAWCDINFVLADVWSGELGHSGSPLNNNGDASNALLYLNGVLVEDLDLTNVSRIRTSAFYRGTQIKSITFGSATTFVGRYAFSNCKNIENIYISNLSAYSQIEFESAYASPAFIASNERVWIGTGDNKEELINLVVPSDVIEINQYTFSGMKKIESVTFHQNVRSIGDRAFLGCDSLNAVYVPTLDTWLQMEIYDSSSNPLYNEKDGVYSGKIFVDGEQLTEVTIPDWMENIPEGLFNKVTGITTLTLHANVKSIGSYSFFNCPDLTRINIPSIADWMKIDFDSYLTALSSTSALYVDGEKIETLVIPESVTEIKKYTFSYGKQFTSVVFHENVEKIGLKAFYFCKNLESVIIPDLDAWCNIEFEEWESNMHKYWNEYGNPLDNDNAKLYLRTYKDGIVQDELVTDLVLGGDVTHVSKGAFFGAKSITSLTVNGAVSIDAFAFFEAINLETVTFNVVPTSIGEYAFYSCKIKTVVIPSVAEWMGIQFGGEWSSPASATTKPSVYLVGDMENVLTTLEVPDGTTVIDSYVFANNASLTEVTLPSSIRSIKLRAFLDSGVKNIKFGGTVEQWLKIDKALTNSAQWYGAALQAVECSDGSLTIDKEGFFTIVPKTIDSSAGE